MVNSPGLGLGRVRSPTMCSWHLPFPFFRTFFKKTEVDTKWNRFPNKKIELEQQFLDLLLELLFLVEKARMRGGCQGAPGKYHSLSGSTWAGTFCIPFVWHPFCSHKIEIFNENCPQNTPKVDTFGSCFQKMKENRKVRFDCTGAYGLHMSPHRGAPRATQNYTKKQTDHRNLFFLGKKSENIQKVTPKRSPNAWAYIVLTSLWRPLEPLVPQSFF